jgi:hypothetical protein
MPAAGDSTCLVRRDRRDVEYAAIVETIAGVGYSAIVDRIAGVGGGPPAPAWPAALLALAVRSPPYGGRYPGEWWNGRHAGFRCQCAQACGGSNPPSPTFVGVAPVGRRRPPPLRSGRPFLSLRSGRGASPPCWKRPPRPWESCRLSLAGPGELRLLFALSATVGRNSIDYSGSGALERNVWMLFGGRATIAVVG